MFIVHKPKTTALPQLSNLLIFTTRIKLNDQGFIVLNFSCILVSNLCLQLYGQNGTLVYEQRTMSWVDGCCIFGWIDPLST